MQSKSLDKTMHWYKYRANKKIQQMDLTEIQAHE